MTAPYSAPDPEEGFQPVFGPDFTGEMSTAEPDFADLTARAAQLAGTQSAALVLAEADGLRFLGRHEFPSELPGLAPWVERVLDGSKGLIEREFGPQAGIAFLAGIPLAGLGGSAWRANRTRPDCCPGLRSRG